jgi:hypothetical protein
MPPRGAPSFRPRPDRPRPERRPPRPRGSAVAPDLRGATAGREGAAPRPAHGRLRLPRGAHGTRAATETLGTGGLGARDRRSRSRGPGRPARPGRADGRGDRSHRARGTDRARAGRADRSRSAGPRRPREVDGPLGGGAAHPPLGSVPAVGAGPRTHGRERRRARPSSSGGRPPRRRDHDRSRPWVRNPRGHLRVPWTGTAPAPGLDAPRRAVGDHPASLSRPAAPRLGVAPHRRPRSRRRHSCRRSALAPALGPSPASAFPAGTSCSSRS